MCEAVPLGLANRQGFLVIQEFWCSKRLLQFRPPAGLYWRWGSKRPCLDWSMSQLSRYRDRSAFSVFQCILNRALWLLKLVAFRYLAHPQSEITLPLVPSLSVWQFRLHLRGQGRYPLLAVLDALALSASSASDESSLATPTHVSSFAQGMHWLHACSSHLSYHTYSPFFDLDLTAACCWKWHRAYPHGTRYEFGFCSFGT